jgi:hypothetical protein
MSVYLGFFLSINFWPLEAAKVAKNMLHQKKRSYTIIHLSNFVILYPKA